MDIPEWDELIDQRRDEKAEAVRFVKAGLGVHDSELVYADDVEALMSKIAGPNWRDTV